MNMERVRVKICGITRLADALCASRVGVDALGFIFHPKSPRAIDPEAASAIISQLPPFVDAVGVFVNVEPEKVAAIIRACGLRYAQLHGEETPDYCQELRAAVPGCGLIKALRLGGPGAQAVTPPEPAASSAHIEAFLLDTYSQETHGGTGAAFDWQLVHRLALRKPILLAGGLQPDNVHAALQASRAYGLDANSGLEDAPGVKNHALIRRFVQQVRAWEQRSSGQ